MNTNFIRKFYVVELNTGSGGSKIATMPFAGEEHELVIVEFLDGAGNPEQVSATNPLPVGGASLESIDTKMTSMLALLAGMTFIEVAATVAAIAVSATKRLIYVTADENNADAPALYIHNGTELKFLLIIP